MTQERINFALARRFVPYLDLIDIPCRDNGEPMADMKEFGLGLDLASSQLARSTGASLWLRRSAAERLRQAQQWLDLNHPGLSLRLVYAYRSMAIQVASFKKMRAELGYGDRTDPVALEATHPFIAVPMVAGHPTGGAIDLYLADQDGQALDFGTPMHGLEPTSYVFSPFISDQATVHRKWLRSAMIHAGFAPYDGEWWHFSYGDREWAAYYLEPQAIYGQLDYDGAVFTPAVMTD
jgi:D-alanyl-D-alanine dipeptidase